MYPFNPGTPARRIRLLVLPTLAILSLIWLASAHGVEQEDPRGDDIAVRTLPTEDAFERFRWYNESFTYSIDILGQTAARAALSSGYPTLIDDHGVVIPIEALATSTGAFHMFYPLRDTALTYVSPATGLPVWTDKVLDERNEVRQYTVAFDRDAFRANVTRVRDGRTQEFFRFGPSDLHDALSWIFDLRSRDLSIGQSYVYFIYDGWKMSRLTARVTGETAVYTGMGMLDVVELRFTREVLSSQVALPYANSLVTLPPVYHVSEGPINLGVGWFTADARRLPVGVAIDTPLGAMRLVIQSHTPPDRTYVPDPRLGNPAPQE